MTTDGFREYPNDEPPGRGSLVMLGLKGTSLYEAAAWLYPVMLGLILTDSLRNMAVDIVNDPLHGNWSLRFLTCTLLVLSGHWMHTWIATLRRVSIVQRTRHGIMRGQSVGDIAGYAMAIWLFWLGIIQLFIFACMAYSVSNEKKFIVEGIINSVLYMAYSADGLNISYTKEWRRPRRAIKALWRSRRLPRSEQFTTGLDDRQKVLLSRGAVYDMMIALVLLCPSVTLFFVVLGFGQAWWIALVWFLGVIATASMAYYVYPYLYLL
jgi:hypothetical protein